VKKLFGKKGILRLRLRMTLLFCYAFLFLSLCLRGFGADVDPVPKLRNWLLKNRDETTGLPYSHVGDKRFERWCITYDAAVSALAFIALGDTDEARKIIDFYSVRPEPQRLGGLIEAVHVKSTASGVDWSVRSGANVWLGIASFHLYKATGDKKYLNYSMKIADWVGELQERDPKSPTFGGIALGPAGDPNLEGDQHIGHDPKKPAFEEIFATEVAIDSSALFNMLAAETGEGRFKERGKLANQWLEKVALNRDEHRWNRGYLKSPDKAVATDIHAWGISMLGVDGLDHLEPGLAEKMTAFIEEHSRVTIKYKTADGKTAQITGFDFVDHESAYALHRPPMVSPEWSFQMANAYKRLADDFAMKGEKQKEEAYREKRRELVGSVMGMADVQGEILAFPYASLPNTMIGHENRTPSKDNFSIIGVAYAVLALKGYEPLQPPPVNRAR